MKKKTVEDDRIAITAKMLISADACSYQVELFRKKYGEKMIPNAKTMRRVGGLSVFWAANHLLHGDYRAAWRGGSEQLHHKMTKAKVALIRRHSAAYRAERDPERVLEKAYHALEKAKDRLHEEFNTKLNYAAVWCWIAQQTGVSTKRLRKQIKTLY